jgi:hypothetical protein
MEQLQTIPWLQNLLKLLQFQEVALPHICTVFLSRRSSPSNSEYLLVMSDIIVSGTHFCVVHVPDDHKLGKFPSLPKVWVILNCSLISELSRKFTSEISCKERIFDECVTQHRLLLISSSPQHSCLDLWIADLEFSKQFGSHWIWTYFNSFRNVCHKNFTSQEELWTSTIIMRYTWRSCLVHHIFQSEFVTTNWSNEALRKKLFVILPFANNLVKYYVR